MAVRSRNSKAILWVVASAVACLVWIVFAAGIEGTPSNTVDSMGRPMGFNDHLSTEHFAIILRNFRPTGAIAGMRFYDWLLIGMHVAGLLILLCFRRSRFTPGFFAAQAVIFPYAWAGMIIVPTLVCALGAGEMDRESFTDWPNLTTPVEAIWVVASIFAFFATWNRKPETLGELSRDGKQAA
jgi:hypothetical protein